MKVVPQAFFTNGRIEKIMADGLSCIIRKTVASPDRNNERYLAAHALTFIQAGSLLVELPDGERRLVKENHFIFLPRGLYMISDILPEQTDFSAMVFFFTENLVEDFLTNHLPDTPSQHTSSTKLLVFPTSPNLNLYVSTLTQLYVGPQKMNTAALAKQKLLELLHLLTQGPQGANMRYHLGQLHQREQKSLKEFMVANFAKPLNVADYAYLSGRSISTFHRDFKRLFATAPKAWLTNKRLEEAKRLLCKPNANIGDVALAVGYENLSHFIRVFRKHYGLTPKQFSIEQRNTQKI